MLLTLQSRKLGKHLFASSNNGELFKQFNNEHKCNKFCKHYGLRKLKKKGSNIYCLDFKQQQKIQAQWAKEEKEFLVFMKEHGADTVFLKDQVVDMVLETQFEVAKSPAQGSYPIVGWYTLHHLDIQVFLWSKDSLIVFLDPHSFNLSLPVT